MHSRLALGFFDTPERCLDAHVGEWMISSAGICKQVLRKFKIRSILGECDIDRRYKPRSAVAPQVLPEFLVGRTVLPLRDLDKPGSADFGVAGTTEPKCGVQHIEFFS